MTAAPLKPWLENVQLHPDVLSEAFSEDIFALDLGPLADCLLAESLRLPTKDQPRISPLFPLSIATRSTSFALRISPPGCARCSPMRSIGSAAVRAIVSSSWSPPLAAANHIPLLRCLCGSQSQISGLDPGGTRAPRTGQGARRCLRWAVLRREDRQSRPRSFDRLRTGSPRPHHVGLDCLVARRQEGLRNASRARRGPRCTWRRRIARTAQRRSQSDPARRGAGVPHQRRRREGGENHATGRNAFVPEASDGRRGNGAEHGARVLAPIASSSPPGTPSRTSPTCQAK